MPGENGPPVDPDDPLPDDEGSTEWLMKVAHSFLRRFAADMRAQDIHVGMGTGGPVRCVTCGEAWPCRTERERI